MIDKDYCSVLCKEIFIRVKAAETEEQIKAANAFIISSIEENWDDAHQEGYDEGYDEAYDDVHATAYKEGYVDGHDEGYDEGREFGYDKGVMEAGENKDV